MINKKDDYIRIQVFIDGRNQMEYFQIDPYKGGIASIVKRVCHRFGIIDYKEYKLEGLRGGRFYIPTLLRENDVVTLKKKRQHFITTQLTDSEPEELCESYDKCRLCINGGFDHNLQINIPNRDLDVLKDTQTKNDVEEIYIIDDIEDLEKDEEKDTDENSMLKKNNLLTETNSATSENLSLSQESLSPLSSSYPIVPDTPSFRSGLQSSQKSLKAKPHPQSIPNINEDSLMETLKRKASLQSHLMSQKASSDDSCNEKSPNLCNICSLSSIQTLSIKSSSRLLKKIRCRINSRFGYDSNISQNRDTKTKKVVVKCTHKQRRSGKLEECPWKITFEKKNGKFFKFSGSVKAHHNHSLIDKNKEHSESETKKINTVKGKEESTANTRRVSQGVISISSDTPKKKDMDNEGDAKSMDTADFDFDGLDGLDDIVDLDDFRSSKRLSAKLDFDTHHKPFVPTEDRRISVKVTNKRKKAIE
ncbi:unnamed protein product [Moneuplotes crassus]|uniref:Uncharacterized protein n=1 Tax=Euplotes crassus TaxID=5936 RepID=A0AAD1UBT6_EUPCR|nr:unnamed protein product [Moneuplotes crassus]